jgi:hypothetical protein
MSYQRNVTIEDALTAIKKVTERHCIFVNEISSKINNYEELINRISKTNYHIIGDNIRCPKGAHVVELFPYNKSIRITKKDPNFIEILQDHLKKNSKPSTQDLQDREMTYRTLENTITKIAEREYNGSDDISFNNEWENKGYKLIEKHYKNYPRAKKTLNSNKI